MKDPRSRSRKNPGRVTSGKHRSLATLATIKAKHRVNLPFGHGAMPSCTGDSIFVPYSHVLN